LQEFCVDFKETRRGAKGHILVPFLHPFFRLRGSLLEVLRRECIALRRQRCSVKMTSGF